MDIPDDKYYTRVLNPMLILWEGPDCKCSLLWEYYTVDNLGLKAKAMNGFIFPGILEVPEIWNF